MASTRIYRTAGTPTSTKKFTLSFWLKKSATGADQFVFNTTTDANNRSQVEFNTDDEINFICKVSGTNIGRLRTTRKFRDSAAFYHIVAVLDTTESTSSNRMKLYVNGVQETDFITETYPSQDADANVSGTHTVGSYYNGSSASNYLNGILTHVHFTDGYVYQASTFGETDTTSGIWKPKTAPSVTYGTNGFFLKFENSGNLDLDSSGNNLTFTTSGTMTQSPDTPSNNFNTLSLVVGANSGVTTSNCNLSFNSGSAVNYGFIAPNFALNKGKWYFETKIGHACAAPFIGDTYQIAERVRQDQSVGTSSEEYAWEGNGYIKTNGGQTAYDGSGASAGDIIGMYVDLDNNKLYVSKNGTLVNSGTGYSITDPDSLTSGYYYIGGISDQCGATANVTADMNFGNGFFGTTAVSSAQADANGEGAFEYSPNQGGAASFDSAAKNFYALNTKNIKDFG